MRPVLLNYYCVAAAVLVGAVAGGLAVRWLRAGGGVGGWRVVGRAAGVGFVGTAVLGAGGLLITGVDGFTLIHVAYVVGTVGVPLAGGIVLVGARGRARPRVVTAVCVLALAAVPVGVYATYVEPFWLKVDRVELALLAMGAVGAAGAADGVDGRIRIGVLADLQTTGVGDYERDAVERLLGFGPDVVVLPGDLYQFDAAVFAERAPGFARLIERIVGEVPHVYLVSGNTDTVAGLRRIVGESGARVLDNEIDTFEVRGVPVRVGGTTLFGDEVAARRMAAALVGGWPGADGVRGDGLTEDGTGGDGVTGNGAGGDGVTGDGLEADGVAGDGRDGGGQAGVRILIGHKPDAIELVRATPVDLVIAGHTHGGQVSLPLLGPPLTLTNVPRHIAAGGLHELHGTPIYVSTGVGRERGNAPQLRLGVRPSIGIIDLVPSGGGGLG
ncbi:metallophosphoesterase [Candidatus Poriferisodalis sp.]|uniref:metallophosphoesterase n=1 Tax=Candidatus Poriferisodalis sp. TaxID=3101277 RepID=UPI003B019943